MNNCYISERLENKINTYLQNKNTLEDILYHWVLNGNPQDKTDAYDILYNSNSINFNLFNLQTQVESTNYVINLKRNISVKLYRYYENQFQDIDILDMELIQQKNWIYTILSICCTNEKDLDGYLELGEKLILNNNEYQQDLNNNNLFYFIEGLLKCINDKINNYYNKIFQFLENHKLLDIDIYFDINKIKRFHWLILLWVIKYNNLQKIKIEDNIKTKFKTYITEAFNLENYDISCDLLYSYGNLTIYEYIPNIINILESIIKNETRIKLTRKYIIQYHNLVRCCIAISYINRDNHNLKNYQETIHSLLFHFFKILRKYKDKIWTVLKLEILRCFRKYYDILQDKVIIDNLSLELLDEDTNIVNSACRTLYKFYQVERCTNIILEAVTNTKHNEINNDNTILALSSSLKWMSARNNLVLDSLELHMHKSENQDIRNTARELISEMGGTSAIKKLNFKNTLKENYSRRIEKSQTQVENMFHKTIRDAKIGFRIALGMDIIIFFVGIILILFSGYIAIFNEDSEKWAGVGTSGGTGVLTILYTLFISTPRDKVKENVSHLMYLKMIFLGYLRELNQIDQCFNQNLLENDIISTQTMNEYSNSVYNIMKKCIDLLNSFKPNKNLNLIDKDIYKQTEIQNEINQDNHKDNHKDKYYNYQELSKEIRINIQDNELADKIERYKIDSNIFSQLNDDTWIELGYQSPIERLKIKENIKQIIN